MFVSPPLAAGWAARPYPEGPPPLCGAGGPRRQGVPGRHAPLPWLEDVVHVRAAHPHRQQPRGRSFRKCSQPEATAPRGALTAPLLSSGFQEGTAPPHRSPPRPPPHAVGRAARCPGRSSPTGPCSPLQGPGGSPGRVQALPCSWSFRCPAQPGQGHSPPPGVDGPPHRRPHSQLPPRSLQTQWANCQAPAGARAVPHGTVAWLARAVSLVAWGS